MNELINIDPVSKYFIWMPPKTGTKLCKSIFDDSDFCTYSNYYGNLIKIDNTFTHIHDCNFFKSHEEYKFIMTCRNPYSLFVSMFIMMGPEINKDDYLSQFESFIEEKTHSRIMLGWPDLLKNINYRKPDYALRLEFLEKDYNSLPIIKKNKNYLDGSLNSKLSKKIGSWKDRGNKLFLPDDWRMFYNKKRADDVYYYFANYFEILGYDKNSWKG